MRAPVKSPQLFPRGEWSLYPCWRVECGYTCSGGPDALCQCSLGHQFHFQMPSPILFPECLLKSRLPSPYRERTDHLSDLFVRDEDAHTVLDPSYVVGHNGEIPGALLP